MLIKTVTAVTNANGEPDFTFCIVECSQEDYDYGIHYEIAKDQAYIDGYEGETVVFDEKDGPSFLFDHFVWESATTVKDEDLNFDID